MEYNNEYPMELYPKQLHWQEGDLTATRTTMWSGPGCHEGCQIIFYTDKDGKLVKTEGDPNSPFSQGRLCMRCLELPQLVNSERRLKYPMKRAGERGEDKWERISWDEAYQMIEDFVHDEVDAKGYGRESIISMIGTGRNVSQVIGHNAYANFGAPDLTLCFLSGDSCMLPRTALCYVVMGNQWVADMSQFFDNAQWPAKTPAGVAMVLAALPIGSNFGGIPAQPITGWWIDVVNAGNWSSAGVVLGVVGAVGVFCAVIFYIRTHKYAMGKED